MNNKYTWKGKNINSHFYIQFPVTNFNVPGNIYFSF